MMFPNLPTPLLTTITPNPMATAISATTLGPTARSDSAPFALPLLVLPSVLRLAAPCPLDVANTDGSTVTVFAVFVMEEVENVWGF